MSEDIYEYKVQHRQIDSRFPGWTDSNFGKWVDKNIALDRFERYAADEAAAAEELGRKDFEYRVVRRLKDSEEVFMTEEDL
jgi:hypothetical protein